MVWVIIYVIGILFVGPFWPLKLISIIFKSVAGGVENSSNSQVMASKKDSSKIEKETYKSQYTEPSHRFIPIEKEIYESLYTKPSRRITNKETSKQQGSEPTRQITYKEWIKDNPNKTLNDFYKGLNKD